MRMAQDFLTALSPSFARKTRRTRERKEMIVACLTDVYDLPTGGADYVITTVRQKGYVDRISSDIVYEDKDAYRMSYLYYHGDIGIKKQADEKRTGRKDSKFLGIHCLRKDRPDMHTWQDIEAAMRELAPPLPEPEVRGTNMEVIKKKSASPAHRPLSILADAIKDMAEAEGHIYHNVEELKEENTELKKRLSAAEKEIKSLKHKAKGSERRIAEMENLLTADPAQIAAVETRVRRLTHDILVGLPKITRIGEHWKKEHAMVYRKPVNRLLRDKNLNQEEKDAVIETIEEISVDPFRRPGATEVRWNGDGGEIVPGINTGETYYYTHVGNTHLRVRWVIRNEEGRVHFVDVFRKKTNTA